MRCSVMTKEKTARSKRAEQTGAGPEPKQGPPAQVWEHPSCGAVFERTGGGRAALSPAPDPSHMGR